MTDPTDDKIEAMAREIAYATATGGGGYKYATREDVALAGIKAGMEMGEAERNKLAHELARLRTFVAEARAIFTFHGDEGAARLRARLSALEPRTDEEGRTP